MSSVDGAGRGHESRQCKGILEAASISEYQDTDDYRQGRTDFMVRFSMTYCRPVR
jgi:hypothetical protein